MVEFLSLELVRRKYSGLKKSLMYHELMKCGRFGECQGHKETGECRYLGHYCNMRSCHLDCALRYRRGQGIELKNQFMEIIKANDLWGFYSWTFTETADVRRWLDTADDAKAYLLDLRRGVAKTIKAAMGLTAKTRNVQPGFSIIYHPCSSSYPFIQSSHFHVLCLPVVANLDSKRIKIFPKRIPAAEVKRQFKLYKDNVLRKYGLDRFILDSYVVNLKYVEAEHTSSVIHAFKYTNRIMVDDVLKTVKRVHDDFENFVCIQWDKKEGVGYPHIKTKEDMLDALEFILNPLIQSRMSYGFMRVIDKYSKLLGLERDDYNDDENWVKLYDIEILRLKRNRFDTGSGKVKPYVTVMVRKRDSPERFKRIKPDELRGERAFMSNRKLFKSLK